MNLTTIKQSILTIPVEVTLKLKQIFKKADLFQGLVFCNQSKVTALPLQTSHYIQIISVRQYIHRDSRFEEVKHEANQKHALLSSGSVWSAHVSMATIILGSHEGFEALLAECEKRQQDYEQQRKWTEKHPVRELGTIALKKDYTQGREIL